MYTHYPHSQSQSYTHSSAFASASVDRSPPSSPSHSPSSSPSPSSSFPFPFPDSSPASSPIRELDFDDEEFDFNDSFESNSNFHTDSNSNFNSNFDTNLNTPFPFPSSTSTSNSPTAHPFSGTTKQVRRFRMHERKTGTEVEVGTGTEVGMGTKDQVKGKEKEREKVRGKVRGKRSNSPLWENRNTNKKIRYEEDPNDVTLTPARHTPEHTPEELFQDVVEKAYGECSLHINFESQRLRYIPETAICDLNKIVVLDQYSERSFVRPTLQSQSQSQSLSQFQKQNSSLGLGGRSSLGGGRITSVGRRITSLGSSTPSTRTLPGVPRDQITLSLADNLLSHLPPQLFYIDRLMVLSLRSNNLTFLPPEISLLTSLKELNVGTNKLRFLPSEMMGMCLSKLVVYPNPFITMPPIPIPTPTHSSSSLSSPTSPSLPPSLSNPTEAPRRILPKTKTPSKSLNGMWKVKAISPVKLVSDYSNSNSNSNGVPSLVELCLRGSTTTTTTTTTISSSSSFSHSHPKTELRYDLPPESTTPLPPSIKHRLHYAFPGVIKGYSTDTWYTTDRGDRDRDADADEDAGEDVDVGEDEMTGVGFCPSPIHQRTTSTPSSLFYQHVEERFTWESVIGGVENMGEVPVRWRGCGKGCLAFLDEGDGGGGGGVDGDVDVDGGVDVDVNVNVNVDVDFDMGEVVKPIDLTRVGFTEDDFDDDE
ncbi:hypothetical protein GGU10DRAFT_432127 [Lentinula aff. detonsa]|uniref:L domain-like protein n=1 Tax=Lentinula aff. detonsa TaxID=2804958 RepID=A0AA38L0T4_9AGAR|nr:hypothetical protein GGU10DRAFT_432127 [Lentinula aff. detonsa]